MGEVGGWRLEVGGRGGIEVGGWRLEVGGQKTQQRKRSLAQRRKGAPVPSSGATGQAKKREKGVGDLRIRRTKDIIEAVERGLLPDKIMINVHPQRWSDDCVPWVKELVAQNVKNVIKKLLIGLRN